MFLDEIRHTLRITAIGQRPSKVEVVIPNCKIELMEEEKIEISNLLLELIRLRTKKKVSDYRFEIIIENIYEHCKNRYLFSRDSIKEPVHVNYSNCYNKLPFGEEKKTEEIILKILNIYKKTDLGFEQNDTTNVFFPYEKIIKCLEELKELVDYDYISLNSEPNSSLLNKEKLSIFVEFSALLNSCIYGYKMKAMTNNKAGHICIGIVQEMLEKDYFKKYASYREKIGTLNK